MSVSPYFYSQNPITNSRAAWPSAYQGATPMGLYRNTRPTPYTASNPYAAIANLNPATQPSSLSYPLGTYPQVNGSGQSAFSNTAMEFPTTQATDNQEQPKSSSNNPLDKSFWTSWKGLTAGIVGLAGIVLAIYQIIKSSSNDNAKPNPTITMAGLQKKLAVQKSSIDPIAEAVKAKNKAEVETATEKFLTEVKEATEAAKNYKIETAELSADDKKLFETYASLAEDFVKLAKENVEAGKDSALDEKKKALNEHLPKIELAVAGIQKKHFKQALDERKKLQQALLKQDPNNLTKKQAIAALGLEPLEKAASAYTNSLQELISEDNDGHKPITTFKESIASYKTALESKKDDEKIEASKLEAVQNALKEIDSKLLKGNASLQPSLKEMAKQHLTEFKNTVESMSKEKYKPEKVAKWSETYKDEFSSLADVLQNLLPPSCCTKIDPKFVNAPQNDKDRKALQDQLTKIEKHLTP